MRKRIGSTAAVLVFGVSGLLLSFPAVAGAAGSTSPTTGATPTSCSTSATANVTAANTTSNPVTGSLTATCTFANNANVQITFGSATQSATASGNGTLTITYAATDPSLSIDGGAFQSVANGVTTVTATGANPSGATNTATFLIDVEGPNSATSGSGANGAGGLAFTGADLAALVAAALALILMGTGVVVFTRRRATKAPH